MKNTRPSPKECVYVGMGKTEFPVLIGSVVPSSKGMVTSKLECTACAGYLNGGEGCTRFPQSHLPPPQRVHGPWCCLPKWDPSALPFPECHGECVGALLFSPLLIPTPRTQPGPKLKAVKFKSGSTIAVQSSAPAEGGRYPMRVWGRRPENMFSRWRMAWTMCKPIIRAPVPCFTIHWTSPTKY